MLSAEDMKAAFYLFGLPSEWWPYFVLNSRISEDLARESWSCSQENAGFA